VAGGEDGQARLGVASGVDGAEGAWVGVGAESVGIGVDGARAEVAGAAEKGAPPGTPATTGACSPQPAAAAAITAATPMDLARAYRPEAVSTVGI